MKSNASGIIISMTFASEMMLSLEQWSVASPL
jgi:hypothetical protein